jgi:hypothetical protein
VLGDGKIQVHFASGSRLLAQRRGG